MRKTWRKIFNHILRQRSGMTLVEVLVAFSILLMGIAFLYKSTVMSLNQIRKARVVQEQADRAVSEFYEKKAAETSEEQNIVFSVKKPESDTAEAQWGMKVKVGEAKSSDGYFIYFFGQEGSEK
ncbi:type II secretion system protein [Anaerostipes sp.]|uniref:type II secretion system protein n=1 Tax=Anaerostipes sp. TaxID=1872530 RepID=UPI0025C5A3C2|nr:prepilin-type N-terminal cleavage/methylation domain-containing protein [Anaerostipes sp.]MBS7009302.1 prepilin-type N-terminal cleavage/methylation domain-containing protein [Anaerostipes sp.]